MKNLFSRRSAFALVIGLSTALSAACAVEGGGYGDDMGYYEPYGADYGGWDSGYWVGPYGGARERDHHSGGGRQATPHAYRSAPASHAVPSLPSRSSSHASSRSGGGHNVR